MVLGFRSENRCNVRRRTGVYIYWWRCRYRERKKEERERDRLREGIMKGGDKGKGSPFTFVFLSFLFLCSLFGLRLCCLFWEYVSPS